MTAENLKTKDESGEMKTGPEMDGDGCTTTRVPLTPLNSALESGSNGKLYVVYLQ